ncbi:MAG: acyl-CoA dehydrogenase family protein [Planctomycetes bacterium]|nr:acyl-CoA dehydrogenase family protein [Planctomycetota bacterium]MBI3832838.1 acyl-CoA dehydrogenase family protein [Planctomycetota bacterium]
MDFEFDDDHRMLQQQIREFSFREVAKGAEARDHSAEMPRELIKQLGELGLFGIAIPSEFGGAGMGTIASSIVVEEISKACAGTGVLLSAHNSLCVDPILRFGSPEQKKKYLPRMASGELIGCLSLTEPGSGSDAGAATCMAVLKDDGWHITGTKIFITNGKEAGVMMLIAVTDPDEPKRRLSAFIVEKPTRGLRIGKLEKKLGIKCSSTAEYVFEDCIVPREALLGERGRGMHVALKTLDGGRIGIAAQALGIAEASLYEATKYARTRVQFNKPIGAFQAIQNKIADMAVGVAAARELIYHAAWLKDLGREYGQAAAMAKLFASEIASKAANHAVQVFGGYGYICDYPVERFLRDARITELYEGTSEIHRLVIARGLA